MSGMRSDAFKHSNFRSGPKRSPAAVTCIYFSHSYSVCAWSHERGRRRGEHGGGACWTERLVHSMVCLVFPGALTFMTSANVPLAYVGCWHIILSSTLHGATLAGGEHFFSVPRPSNPPPILCRICPVGGKRTLAFLSSLSSFFLHLNFFFLLFSSHSFSTAPCFLQQSHGLVSCTHLVVILFSAVFSTVFAFVM